MSHNPKRLKAIDIEGRRDTFAGREGKSPLLLICTGPLCGTNLKARSLSEWPTPSSSPQGKPNLEHIASCARVYDYKGILAVPSVS